MPLYEQLTVILRGQIESGELTGRVPSIVTLSQQYEVARNTAQRALETLRDEGLIVSRHGKGFYVARKS